MPKFKKDDSVFAKNFGKGENWVPGTIIEVLSPKSCLVQVKDIVWKRHIDQIKLWHVPYEYENMNAETSNMPSTEILSSYRREEISKKSGIHTEKNKAEEGNKEVGIQAEKEVDMQTEKDVSNTEKQIEQNFEKDNSEIDNSFISQPERRLSKRTKKIPKRLVTEK